MSAAGPPKLTWATVRSPKAKAIAPDETHRMAQPARATRQGVPRLAGFGARRTGGWAGGLALTILRLLIAICG